MGEFTYFGQEQPLWVVGATFLAAQLVAREAGSWIRRRSAAKAGNPDEESSDKSFILSGVLGLLALMIAFTFGLAMSRYEARRELVVTEANTIGTAEMRVQLIGTPQGEALAQLLQAYARTRLQFGLASAVDKPALARTSEAQRSALQKATVTTLLAGPDTVTRALVAPAVNSVLDVGVEREAMLTAKVPVTVLVALTVFALMTAAIIGFSLTGSRARQRSSTTILFALLTLAILLILELDRPQSGTIKTDQTPMMRLVAGFPPAEAPAPR